MKSKSWLAIVICLVTAVASVAFGIHARRELAQVRNQAHFDVASLSSKCEHQAVMQASRIRSLEEELAMANAAKVPTPLGDGPVEVEVSTSTITVPTGSTCERIVGLDVSIAGVDPKRFKFVRTPLPEGKVTEEAINRWLFLQDNEDSSAGENE